MAMVGRISTNEAISNAVLSIGITIHTVVLLYGVLEQPRSEMSPGVHGNNLLGVSPLRERANVRRRLGVGEVGTVNTPLVMDFWIGDKGHTGGRRSVRCWPRRGHSRSSTNHH
jgi:hypothetical protein